MHPPPGIWRLIDTGPLDGPTNMAVDEALLESFDPQRSSPVLRLYGWEPPTLSLGRFQRADDVLDLGRCAARGIPVVRRITGGGVIFHADELTYALVCSPRHLPAGATVKESFRFLTSFLLRFYERLGLHPRYAVDAVPNGARLGERHPFCFAGLESYDVLVGGRKIGGNAQRRLKEKIFQHGSVPLADRSSEGAGFLLHPEAARAGEGGSLAGSGIDRPTEELKGIMVESFAEAIGGDVRRDRLNDRERTAVDRLVRQKYGADRWNLDGTP